MNTLRKQILIGMTVLGLSGAAFSTQAAEPASPAAHGQRHGQWAERAAERQQRLHDALKLSAAQEGAWSNYQAALAHKSRMDQAQGGARTDWKTLTAPQRLELQIARSREHTERMEARLAALQSFYGALNAEQKKLFDEKTQGHGRHHRKGGRGMHHMGA
ncbi:Spy/CpxP family protein refolding chaperone [Massilia sp. CF038]|uniref:Spy/CpxP family protein refolding chaperone n=1 Tax=Massilia sp. CF038 TaxID=1881045 RepID=UPI000922FA7F|nr:Spy/CpxP family protein refolding chaperone [Massilia sp. CF038]SHH60761.1 LTXXQ motif family protein [Massilia sp. CF038]